MCTLFITIADKDGLQAQNYLTLGNALGNMPRNCRPVWPKALKYNANIKAFALAVRKL